MIIYHLLFDLNYFGFLSVDLSSFEYLVFARVIQVSFLMLVGVSSYILFSKSKSFDLFVKKQINRFIIVGLNAILITLATWIAFPDQYISFGILHLIAVSIVIITVLSKLDRGAIFVLSLIIFALSLILDHRTYYEGISWLGFYTDNFSSLDYFPILPWLGVPLIGFSLGELIVSRAAMLPTSKYLEIFSVIGRRSLLIYMIHQPIIFVLILIFATILD